MKILLGFLHTLLIMGTFAVSYNYYQGFPYEIPLFFYIFLGLGVVGVSVVWVVGHIIGAGAFGLAGGDFWDGMKMGAMIGGCQALGRLWPYMLAWAFGAFFGEGPNWHTVVSFVMFMAMLAVSRLVAYIWSKVQA